MASIQPVTRDQLVAQLEEMKGQVINPNEGVFGPQSVFWRVVRHISVFVGACRAGLL